MNILYSTIIKNLSRLQTVHTSMHSACNHISSIYFRIIYFTFVTVVPPILQARLLITCVADTMRGGCPGRVAARFQPGRSTLDLIFTMKMIMEKSWEWGLQKFILFIDFEKAFDRMQRSDLWSVLANHRYKIPPKLRRVIRNTYSQCLSKVQGRDRSNDWFSIVLG